VPAARLDEAVRALGRQTGSSIGFRNGGLASIRVRAVRGKMSAGEALKRMLSGTGARARRVAADTWLVEHAPRPPARPRVRKARRELPPGPSPPEPEIVITATKRDIPLGSYPGGVQVLDGDQLTLADGARGSDAIGARVASVASTHLGPGRNKLFIRGIADSSFVGPTQATVGQYWGNSRITYSAPDPSLRLYDVRSVEVLEGPQGTLYGAGSLGGVVRVVPHAPELDALGGRLWGGVQAVQHGEPGADGGTILNVPLVQDRLALRALLFGSVDGGYIDDRRRDRDDINRVRTVGGRIGLRYRSGNDWTIDLNAVGQRIDGDDSQYADRDGDGLSRSSAVAQPYRNDYWLAELVATKSWGSLELTSSLGYTRQYVSETFEGAALADPARPEEEPVFDAPTAAFTQTNRIEMFTIETRLARRGPNGTGWVAGVSLLSNRARVNRNMELAIFEAPLTGVTNKVEEATLYGEGTIQPLDRFTVTFGGRLTGARLSGDSEDAIVAIAFRNDPGARASRTETRLLPSVAAAYRPTDRLTLFARYQQGFRPGGIAVRRDFIQRFEGDRVATTEAGARYRDRTLDVSLTAAWTQWRNIQADLIDGFGFPMTANVGDGRVLSVGLAAQWRPIQGLALDAAVYLNDSKVTQASGLLLSTLEGTGDELNRLPNVADASVRFGFRYSSPLNGRDTLQLDGFARYVGQSTLGIGPILGQLQGDYLDTGLELRIGDAVRGISLSITNLLDSRGNRFALGSPFLVRDRNQITPLQPRSLRLGFDFAF